MWRHVLSHFWKSGSPLWILDPANTAKGITLATNSFSKPCSQTWQNFGYWADHSQFANRSSNSFYGTQHQSSSITHCHSLVNLSIVYRKCKTSRSIHRPTVQRFSHENNGFKNHDTTAKCGIRLRGLDSSVHTVSGQSYLFFRLWRGLSFEVVMRFFAYSSWHSVQEVSLSGMPHASQSSARHQHASIAS
jgi:hypothetical protein